MFSKEELMIIRQLVVEDNIRFGLFAAKNSNDSKTVIAEMNRRTDLLNKITRVIVDGGQTMDKKKMVEWLESQKKGVSDVRWGSSTRETRSDINDVIDKTIKMIMEE